MAVGDVNSTARGSGARYNDGKPNIALIPVALIAGTMPSPGVKDMETVAEQNALRVALSYLGNFQTTRNVRSLDAALSVLSPYWEETARVFDYGRTKYAEWNWAKGMAWSIPLACAGRHALAIFRNEGIDNPEAPNNGSGLRHIGHFMCNLVMLRTFVDTFPEGDDLPPVSLFVKDSPIEREQTTWGGHDLEVVPCACPACPTSAHAHQAEEPELDSTGHPVRPDTPYF